jgi:UDP-glucose 4-epimerase
VAELTGARILVTGGAGFIGRSVVPALRRAGAAVSVVDRHPYPVPDVPCVVGDLRDPAVRDAALTTDLTGVVHLAAETSVLGSLARPAVVQEVNVGATAALLELARLRGIRRFLMASTNAVVGDAPVETPGGAVLHEDLPLRPLTPYGATKAAAEMLLSGYAGGYAMTTCAVRFTNVYGPGMAGKDSMVPRIMRAVRADAPVQVYGDGTQRRDFVHVDDAVAGLLAAWRADHLGPLVVGAGRSVSVLELLAAAGRVVGRPIRVEHVEPKPGEMPAVIVSIDRARSLGYRPSVPLAGGLATVWDEFR